MHFRFDSAQSIGQNPSANAVDRKRHTGSPVGHRNPGVVILEWHARQVAQPQQSRRTYPVVAIHDNAGVLFDGNRCGPFADFPNRRGEAFHVPQIHILRRHEEADRFERYAIGQVIEHLPSPAKQPPLPGQAFRSLHPSCMHGLKRARVPSDRASACPASSSERSSKRR